MATLEPIGYTNSEMKNKMKKCMFVCMHVCMVITYSKSRYQPGKVANPARGQLNRRNEYFPVPVRA